MNSLGKKLLFSIILITAFAVIPNIVSACSCIQVGNETARMYFRQSSTVALLKLQSLKDVSPDLELSYRGRGLAEMQVQKVFKGKVKAGNNINLIRGDGADCLWPFVKKDIGKEYLFYLSKEYKNNTWMASICTRSGLSKDLTADILYLEKREKVQGKTRLSGTFSKLVRSNASNLYKNKRIADKKLRIVGNGKNVKLLTDKNGVFEIYDLPPGKYKVFSDRIPGYKLNPGWKQSNPPDCLPESCQVVQILPGDHTEVGFYYGIVWNR